MEGSELDTGVRGNKYVGEKEIKRQTREEYEVLWIPFSLLMNYLPYDFHADLNSTEY